MVPYWLMFLLPSFGALLGLGQHKNGQRRDQGFLIVLFVVFAVLIGLRDGTGGDFFNYQRTVDTISFERFSTSISQGDPAFTIIAEISNWFGFGIYGVNSFCGVALLYGLLRFVRTLPDPWLAIAAAVPYMVIVIGMGYIRQGVAIGFILLALIDLERRAHVWLAVHLTLALTFHITAVCILPIIGLSMLRRQPLALVALSILGVLVYIFVLKARFDSFYTGYVLSNYDSAGAAVRLLMNAVPSIVFLAFRNRFSIVEPLKSTWTIIALLSLVMLPAVAVFPSTTALDRIGLFFSPIQLVVFGYMTKIFAADVREQRLAAFAAILFYGVVLLVWLNFAANSSAWVPYRWLLSPDPMA